MQKQSVGVYYAGQDFGAEPPAFFVERKVAREWLREGKAWSIHHGRDIALEPEMEEYLAGEIDAQKLLAGLVPEASCVMGERVVFANAEEKTWARRIVRAWNRQVAVEEHLQSLERCRGRESKCVSRQASCDSGKKLVNSHPTFKHPAAAKAAATWTGDDADGWGAGWGPDAGYDVADQGPRPRFFRKIAEKEGGWNLGQRTHQNEP
ncbi:MAG TPA: hypothetical protein VI636_14760 [Candidatus Angelobacter sp.]